MTAIGSRITVIATHPSMAIAAHRVDSTMTISHGPTMNGTPSMTMAVVMTPAATPAPLATPVAKTGRR